jgi:two-component system cell cycle response regulator DivK
MRLEGVGADMENKTVLLVEDSPDTRIIYSTILQHNGYTVLQAETGEEGLRLAREAMPDLILMNVSIPLVDGWKATALLKRDPHTAHIPVIAVTAFTRKTDKRKAREVGCDGYIPKPADPTRVLAEVQRFLGMPSMPPAQPPLTTPTTPLEAI